MYEGINTVFSTMIYATRKNQVASFIDKKKKKKNSSFKILQIQEVWETTHNSPQSKAETF
jgi:hypothetical protein